jgi:hypothetical protein
MKITTNKIIIVLFLFTASIFAGPAGPPPPGMPPPPPSVPIDSGVWCLAFAAILLGVYKIYQLQLNKKTPM